MRSVNGLRRIGAELHLLTVVLLFATACGGDPASTQVQDPGGPQGQNPGGSVPLPVSPALVSGPFEPKSEVQASIVNGEVWVSMVPGTIPDGVAVTVRNAGSSAGPVSAQMAGGGFDPLAIPGGTDDTLIIVVHRTRGDSLVGTSVVPVRMRPRVVRVEPANHKTDVPLNSRVTVVFSQPIDWSTVPRGLLLLRHGVPVPGTVSAVVTGGDTVAAEFVPDSLLVPGTTYQLKLLSSVRDRNGFPFQEELDLSFGTVGTPALGRDTTPPQINVPSPLNGEVFSPRWLYLSVTAGDNYALKKVFWVLLQGPGVTKPKVMHVAEGFAYEAIATGYSGSYDATFGAGPDGLAYGTYIWQAVALDSNDNRAESPPITITVAPPTAGQLLRVVAFSIKEIPLTGLRPWAYGPRLTVITMPGASDVRIRGLSGLHIPGVVADAGAACSTWKVPSGVEVSLFGDWAEMDAEFDSERRATGAEASARLYYTDAAGGNYELELTGGAIVPGTWDATFTSNGEWYCL